MATSARGAGILLGCACTLWACKPKPVEVTVDVKSDAMLEMMVSADPYSNVTMLGQKVSGIGHINVPALSLPAGPQTIDMTVERKGKTWTEKFSFTRAPVEPRLAVTSPPELEGWKVPCRGELCANAKAENNTVGAGYDGKLVLLVTGPVGEKVEIEGTTYTLVPYDYTKPKDSQLSVDVSKRVADVALDVLGADKSGVFVDIPVKLVADATKTVALSIETRALKPAVAAVLSNVDKGPVVFPGEAAPPSGPPHSLYFPAFNTYFGKPGTVRDLDLVAVERKLTPRAAGTCGPYGTIGTIEHRLVDREVSVYERRTGKLRDKKTFDAKSLDCPGSWTGVQTTVNGVVVNERATSNSYDNYPDPERMRAWLKTFVR